MVGKKFNKSRHDYPFLHIKSTRDEYMTFIILTCRFHQCSILSTGFFSSSLLLSGAQASGICLPIVILYASRILTILCFSFVDVGPCHFRRFSFPSHYIRLYSNTIEYESMFWYHYTKDTVSFRMLTCRLIFISKCKNMPILTYSWTYSYSIPLSVLYFQLKWFNMAFSFVPAFTWNAILTQLLHSHNSRIIHTFT